MGRPKSSRPNAFWRVRNTRHMTSRTPCITPATAYEIHAEQRTSFVSPVLVSRPNEIGGNSLVQSVPGLSAMLRTMRTAPGVWRHIMGMLSAPTCCRRHVCAIWGAYWSAASKAEETPRNVAQSCSCRERCVVSGDGFVESSRNVTNVMNALHGGSRGSGVVITTKRNEHTCGIRRPRRG